MFLLFPSFTALLRHLVKAFLELDWKIYSIFYEQFYSLHEKNEEFTQLLETIMCFSNDQAKNFRTCFAFLNLSSSNVNFHMRFLKEISAKYCTNFDKKPRNWGDFQNLYTDQETWSVRFPHDKKKNCLRVSINRFLYCMQEGFLAI